MLDHDDVEASYYRLTGVSLPPVRLGAPRRSSAALPPLPLPGGDLVGRDEVIADIVSLVDEGLRVITITGPGGMGKTRCAVEAARRASTPCRGFIDLSALSTGAGLAMHLAGTFGVPDRDDPVSAVAAHLTGPRTTVVLDNLEQIADAAEVVGELAQRCPSVVWLVTSQTELGLPRNGSSGSGRSTPTSPRPTAAPGRSASATLLAAAAERRGVRVVADESLEEIATLIGGIPLALELAACQLQYLEPAVLLRSLQDPIEALVDPRRAIGRHRSMRACFELAADRLSPDATDLFAIVSGRPAGTPYDDLLACWSRGTPLSRAVAELVEAGFASTSPDSSGATRLTQLPLVRAYGRTRSRPADADALDGALDLAVFGRVQALFTGAPPGSIEPDLADIRRLLQRGLDQPDALDTALQLAASLILYWWEVRITEGRRWLDDLLERAASQPSAMRPYAAQTAAFLDFYVGDGETARRRLESALGEELADPSAHSRLLALLAMLDVADGAGRGGIDASRAGGRAGPCLR